MVQPTGFKDTTKPNHVYRLNKAIYGLKQAPQAWYLALKNALMQLGFQNFKANSSLFSYKYASIICYSSFVSSIIDKLRIQFSLKYMCPLHFFLGVKVIPTSACIFLSQHKYILELLHDTNMAGAKDISTPLSRTTTLKLLDGTNVVDATQY